MHIKESEKNKTTQSASVPAVITTWLLLGKGLRKNMFRKHGIRLTAAFDNYGGVLLKLWEDEVS